MLTAQLRVQRTDTPVFNLDPSYAIWEKEADAQFALRKDRKLYLAEIENTLKQKAEEMKKMYMFLKSELLKGGNADNEEKTQVKKACFSSIQCSVSGLDNIIAAPIWQGEALSDKAINDCFTTFCENPNFDLLSDYEGELPFLDSDYN